jgi:hypothetical protein
MPGKTRMLLEHYGNWAVTADIPGTAWRPHGRIRNWVRHRSRVVADPFARAVTQLMAGTPHPGGVGCRDLLADQVRAADA